MKTIRVACTAIALTSLLALSGQADELMERPNLAFRVTGGQFNLEGPAVNGPDVEDEQDVDSYGIQLQGLKPLGDNVFATAGLDWSMNDSEFQFIQAMIGLGYRYAAIERSDWGLSLYGVAGLEYARSEGLSDYANDPAFGGLGTGEDGDDIGVSVEGGFNVTFAENWESSLYAKYYNFGDGDGPEFGARLNYAINADWTAVSSWEGTWVEDAGFNIDLDVQKFTLGLARTF